MSASLEGGWYPGSTQPSELIILFIESNFDPKPSLLGHVLSEVSFEQMVWAFFRVAGKLYEGLKLDPTGTDKTRCPVSVVFASKEKGIDTIWDYHRSFPDMEFDFQDYMKATLKSAFYSTQHTVRGFDWSKVNSVVDVGGSAGHISMAIHDQFPHIKFVVEDLGDVIRDPQQQLPQRYTDRISFLEHSFFDAQPVTADCYLLHYVLHNWPDEDAKKIIAGLSPALGPGKWVVIADHVVPEQGKTYQSLEGLVRVRIIG
ncbi:O-methyltransferase, family 2 [Penicillium griseofulvum]|uniref:O-methyltransferase, family 2 n=1 Tax=Penicillium patulum TaxID=5078 RepID=A0A135LSI0_PENPA|nr:O-methyltransferase, family 2 [Penicillium griseofulvum]KXG51923.1 O-methyltransferase, family 2 [Penicillium griseofulvum]